MSTLPFSGAATPLAPSDLAAAAQQNGYDVATLTAVMTVETGNVGGFLTDGSNRPRILFEAETFSRLTKGRYNHSHPKISSAVANWKLYQGGAAEYIRLNEAVGLNRSAALQSTSWGLFQVMGENFAAAVYSDVEAMVADCCDSEAAQLGCFLRFINPNHLSAPLRAHDWATFARGYNGPNYAANRYVQKLIAAYALAIGGYPAPLRLGCTGGNVKILQSRLTVIGYRLAVLDGRFGRETEQAVMLFQASHSLATDGVVGPQTAAALGIAAPQAAP